MTKYDNESGPSGELFYNEFEINECVQGAGELDTYVTFAPSSEIDITYLGGSTYLVEDSLFPGFADLLDGVERIEFEDGTLALDIDGVAGQAYRLYQAAFARAPDQDGLMFWIDHLDAGNVTLEQTAGYFMQSEEFEMEYGTESSISDNRFIELLYQNVLGRLPDQPGYDFWTNVLDGGNYSRDRVLIDFSESPENQGNVVGAIGTGMWLPDYSWLDA